MTSKSFQQVDVHLRWAAAGRVPMLTPVMRGWLWPAMAESARSVGCHRVVVGGYNDHVHLVVALPMTVAIAELVRRLQGASVRLLHLKGLACARWQEGYTALAVSRDRLAAVEAYIHGQEQHHGNGLADFDSETSEFYVVSPAGAS